MSTSLNTYAYETPANPLTADALEAEKFIQDSYDAKGYMMEVLFAYAPEQVYKIYLQQGFVTDIRLAMDEVVDYVTSNFEWDMSSQVVYRFMMAVRRKIQA